MKLEEISKKSIKLRDYIFDVIEKFGKENDIPEHLQLATIVAMGKMIERQIEKKANEK